jgi:tRNA-specific 2-thiouridylase
MKNWHDDSVTISNDCPWLEDSNDALLVAEKLESLFKRFKVRNIRRKSLITCSMNMRKDELKPRCAVIAK